MTSSEYTNRADDEAIHRTVEALRANGTGLALFREYSREDGGTWPRRVYGIHGC